MQQHAARFGTNFDGQGMQPRKKIYPSSRLFHKNVILFQRACTKYKRHVRDGLLDGLPPLELPELSASVPPPGAAATTNCVGAAAVSIASTADDDDDPLSLDFLSFLCFFFSFSSCFPLLLLLCFLFFFFLSFFLFFSLCLLLLLPWWWWSPFEVEAFARAGGAGGVGDC
jgi:hypothetical protein